MKKISELLTAEVHSVALVGHERPDGDCAGSVLGTWHYLTENYPELSVTAYLEPLTDNIAFLKEGIPVSAGSGEGLGCDLAISLDCAEAGRIGAGRAAFSEARHRACIDHHATNRGFTEADHIIAGASATCEILCDLFDTDRVSRETAVCLYTGIAHDTGVFRYEAVSGETLRKAAVLLDKGVPFSKIVRESLTEEPYLEKKAAAAILTESTLLREERLLYALAPLEFQRRYSVDDTKLGAVVSYLNEVKEAEVVLFLYQRADGSWKGSLRTKSAADATVLAGAFGGGGHVRAAGFSFTGDPMEAVQRVRQKTAVLLAESGL